MTKKQWRKVLLFVPYGIASMVVAPIQGFRVLILGVDIDTIPKFPLKRLLEE